MADVVVRQVSSHLFYLLSHISSLSLSSQPVYLFFFSLSSFSCLSLMSRLFFSLFITNKHSLMLFLPPAAYRHADASPHCAYLCADCCLHHNARAITLWRRTLTAAHLLHTAPSRLCLDGRGRRCLMLRAPSYALRCSRVDAYDVNIRALLRCLRSARRGTRNSTPLPCNAQCRSICTRQRARHARMAAASCTIMPTSPTSLPY